jgi:enamidase
LPARGSVLIRNIGALVTGDLLHPLADADAVYIEDGLVREVGSDRTHADTVIDAQGLTLTLIHSGGVSRSGLIRPVGAAIIRVLEPDVVAHASGGPIPMPLAELDEVISGTRGYLEVAYAGNPRWTVHLVERIRERGELARLTVGTDTPSGTGTTPRGMLRTLCLMCSLGGVTPAEAICLASGNTARAHGVAAGLVQPGCPADLVLMGRVSGSSGADALDSLRLGDLPGISTVLVDGAVLVFPRSQQTPPPDRLARVTNGR